MVVVRTFNLGIPATATAVPSLQAHQLAMLRQSAQPEILAMSKNAALVSSPEKKSGYL